MATIIAIVITTRTHNQGDIRLAGWIGTLLVGCGTFGKVFVRESRSLIAISQNSAAVRDAPVGCRIASATSAQWTGLSIARLTALAKRAGVPFICSRQRHTSSESARRRSNVRKPSVGPRHQLLSAATAMTVKYVTA